MSLWQTVWNTVQPPPATKFPQRLGDLVVIPINMTHIISYEKKTSKLTKNVKATFSLYISSLCSLIFNSVIRNLIEINRIQNHTIILNVEASFLPQVVSRLNKSSNFYSKWKTTVSPQPSFWDMRALPGLTGLRKGILRSPELNTALFILNHLSPEMEPFTPMGPHIVKPHIPQLLPVLFVALLMVAFPISFPHKAQPHITENRGHLKSSSVVAD